MQAAVRSFRALALCLYLLLCSYGINAQAGLQEQVNKYRNSSISSASLQRLRQYDHLIQYFSSISYFKKDHKVSPDFIRALILAESGGDANARSSKDARGLGQIIPSTGLLAAQELLATNFKFQYISRNRLQKFTTSDLYDPAINILFTCYLISKYNFKFAGKLDLVVSAWNAGENSSHLKRGRHTPYPETEDLIGKINGYYVFLLKQKAFRWRD